MTYFYNGICKKNRIMKKHPVIAGVLSFLVPGLGQMYVGESTRGAMILVATIIFYNLNSIFLPVFIEANPDPNIFWKHWLPRLLHDVGAFYSIIFWIWAIADAVQIGKKLKMKE